jgi:hypothetical protein
MPMPTGPFVVGVVFSTAVTVMGLRQFKYRSELLRYGFMEENRPFGHSTPLADSKDYSVVSVIMIFFFFIICLFFQELRQRMRDSQSKEQSALAKTSNEVAATIAESTNAMFTKIYETVDSIENSIRGN